MAKTQKCSRCSREQENAVYQKKEYHQPAGWAVVTIAATPVENWLLCGECLSRVRAVLAGAYSS